MSSDDEPAIVVTPIDQVKKRRPIDAVAKGTYLAVLAKTGSRSAAAAAARPHLRTRSSAMNAFEAHISANPAFRAQVEDIEAHVAGLLDTEILERALHGKVTYQKYEINERTGERELVEERIEHDNKLLVQAARNVGRRVNPAAWAPDEKRVVVEGGTTNTTVTMDVDKLLDGMSTEAIRSLLESAKAAKALPAPEVTDAELLEEDDLVADAIERSKPLDNGTDSN